MVARAVAQWGVVESALAVPITVDASAVQIASSVESQSACMNSRRWKKLANHLSEKPCGGNVK